MLQINRVEEAGLYTASGLVPLQGVSVAVEVVDVASKVTVRQRFRNNEDKPIEAAYCFPLEEGSAVCGFEAQIGDRLIRGKVEERDEAFKSYDEAMAEGHGAFLLDQEKPNIFVASVGNLNPGQQAILSLSYVAELPIHDDQIRLMIPTTVSPRYAPADADSVEVDVISPPLSLEVPYGLSLNVHVREGKQIEKISSPSHKIKAQQGEDDWNITLANSQCQFDRDFILEIKLKEPKSPVGRLQVHENGDRAIMLRLYPEFESEEEVSPSEVIFLLDCSGSMSGPSIAHAKKALELCLRTLAEGDRFNIVRFGSQFESLFRESRAYTDESLEEAVNYIRKVDADLGGTEIYPALDYILDIPVTNSHKRELIVLTDGQVFNEEEVISLVRRHQNSVRIFSFGIGYGASESLVRGLARATRGAAEFISPDEAIEEKVLRQFARLATPALTDIRIDWKGLRVKQAPAEIPPIFSGDSFTVYGLVEGGNPDGGISLLAKLGEREITWSAPVSLDGAGNLIPTLWARNYIRDIEEDSGLKTGSRQAHRKAKALKKKLVDIGMRFQLVSRETSFVAIETRADLERTTQMAEYRRVPIQLTREWHGLGATIDVGRYCLSTAEPSLTDSAEVARLSDIAAPHQPHRYEPVVAAEDVLWVYDLLTAQSAAGWFKWTERLADLIGRPLKELKKLAFQLEGIQEQIRDEVLVTALTLIVLETKGQNYKASWSRAAQKAREWLNKNAKDAVLNGKPVVEGLREELSLTIDQRPA